MTAQQTATSPRLRADTIRVSVILAATLLALVPLFVVESLPLHDYPSHLARMYVLLQAGHDEVLNRYYEIHWALMPNLAMDILVPPLARAIGSVELAGKLFVALTMLLLSSGTMFLHAAIHRRVSLWPLLSVVLLYNGILWFGFLNFLFSLGLFLWAFGIFVRTQDWPVMSRVPLCAILCVILFVAHLFGFALFLVAVAGWSFGRMWVRDLTFRGVVREGLLVLPATLLCLSLFLFATPTSSVASETSWSDLRRPWHYIAKLQATLFAVDFNDSLTLVAALLVASIVVLGFVAGWVRLDRRMVPVLGLLSLCFAAMPMMVSSSYFAYHRMPIVLAFVSVTALDWTVRAPARALAAILFAFIVLRVEEVSVQWRQLDNDFAPIRSAMRTLPKGTRLTTAMAAPPGLPAPALLHVPSHIVLDADGFYPGVFSFPGQQPINFTPAYAELGGHIGSRSIFHRFPLNFDSYGPQFDPFVPTLLAQFDVLLTFQDSYLTLPQGLVLLKASGPWKLYRLAH
ncbi:hypothetical protein [Roseiterribacter gracilis]|uniref:Uncharacterized protein n=1 Tax=Roseiterribacter gracilis TaxID=2812848 RepID=A0A8S8XGS1_9PROT|nr:hypothetical protein TMPK1_34380 [Rhodospirillales bacterium TMPK1]